MKSQKMMKRMVANCLHLRLRDWGQFPELYHQICPEKVVVLEVAHSDQVGHHCQMAVVLGVCRKLSRLPQVGEAS